MGAAVRPKRSGERVFAAQAAQRLTRPVQPRLTLGLAARPFSLMLGLPGGFFGLCPVCCNAPAHGQSPGEGKKEAEGEHPVENQFHILIDTGGAKKLPFNAG